MSAGAVERRVFVGLRVPADVARELVTAASATLAGESVRVYPPEDVHLTLVFLGERSNALVDSLARALPLALRACAPLELAVERCGVFPEADVSAPARAFWAGVSSVAPGALDALRDVVFSALVPLEAAGAPPLETGSWTPHLTLARPLAHARVSAPEAFRAARFALRWRADEVVLFESRRERTAGERYAALARIPLIAPAR